MLEFRTVDLLDLPMASSSDDQPGRLQCLLSDSFLDRIFDRPFRSRRCYPDQRGDFDH